MDILNEEQVKYFRKDASGNDIFVTAYEIYNNIWVIPHRFIAEKITDLPEVTEPEQFGVYDKTYLMSSVSQTDFIAQVKDAFNNISEKNGGANLLDMIASAVVLPQDNKASNTTLHCLKDGRYDHDVVANVIIWGPGNNINQPQVISRDMVGAKNGLGSATEILWNPSITLKNFGTGGTKSSVDNLVFMLVKSLYRLYGFGLDDIMVPLYQQSNTNKCFMQSIENLLLQGGVTAQINLLQPSIFLQDKLDLLQTNFNQAKSNITNIIVNSAYTKLLQIKFSRPLNSLLTLWTSSWYSDQFAVEDEIGDGLTNFLGPQAIIDTTTNDIPSNMYQKPTKTVTYTKNPKLSYSLFDLTQVQVIKDYFQQYAFTDDELVMVPGNDPQLVLDPSSEEPISTIILPYIYGSGTLTYAELSPRELLNWNTEELTIDHPTIELAVQCAKGDNKWRDNRFTSVLSDDLDLSKDLTYVFSESLSHFLNEDRVLNDTDLNTLLSILNSELLQEIPILNTTKEDSRLLSVWIDHVFNDVFGINLPTFLSDMSMIDEELGSTEDMELVLPNALPRDQLKLKPFLLYQWFVKRHSLILRLESSFYRLLQKHAQMLIGVVESKYSGNNLEKFENEIYTIFFQTEINLDQLFDDIAYQDMVNKIKAIVDKPSITNEDLIYSPLEYSKILNQITERNTFSKVENFQFYTTINGLGLPQLWLGSLQLDNIRALTKTPMVSFNGESSYQFNDGVGFRGEVTTRYLDNVNQIDLIGKFGMGKLLITLDKISIYLNSSSISIGTDFQNPDYIQDFGQLIGWHKLRLIFNQKFLEVYDLFTSKKLADFIISSDILSDESVNTIQFLSQGGTYFLNDFRLKQLPESEMYPINKSDIGFYSGCIYDEAHEPIKNNQSVCLTSSILGNTAILTINDGKPVFYDSESTIGLINITLEQDDDNTLLDSQKHVLLRRNNTYIKLGTNNIYEFGTKDQATKFRLLEAHVYGYDQAGYLIQSDDNQMLSVGAQESFDGPYSLVALTNQALDLSFASPKIVEDSYVPSIFNFSLDQTKGVD